MRKRDDMYDNFNMLNERILDVLDKSDLEIIREKLSYINKATICSGVGGSSVVSEFASKVLSKKNKIITSNFGSRDMLYKDFGGYSNILVCSYSGNNLGVDVAFDNTLNKYLLSTGNVEGICNLNYKGDIYKERSFISLGATLIPMSILLNYYLDGDCSLIYEIISDNTIYSVKDSFVYEILSGYEESTACKYLETTMIESGIGIPIIHDKYDYCHGRSTISFHNENSLIFFDNNSELDNLYNEILDEYYTEVIRISNKFDDMIVNDFYFTYQSMLLTKYIAEKKGKDLSMVEYSPLVKKLYRYNGKI